VCVWFEEVGGFGNDGCWELLEAAGITSKVDLLTVVKVGEARAVRALEAQGVVYGQSVEGGPAEDVATREHHRRVLGRRLHAHHGTCKEGVELTFAAEVDLEGYVAGAAPVLL